jgi:hypothetical protein
MADVEMALTNIAVKQKIIGKKPCALRHRGWMLGMEMLIPPATMGFLPSPFLSHATKTCALTKSKVVPLPRFPLLPLNVILTGTLSFGGIWRKMGLAQKFVCQPPAIPVELK